MKLAIISDVHLDDIYSEEAEYRVSILNSVEADYLILAGDICNNRNARYWFDKIRPNVKKIIVVKGNHEFFNNDIGYFVTYPDHVVCLTAEQPFEVNGYTFVGDTLWTNIPEQKMEYVESFMMDYKHIHGFENCSVTNSLHNNQLKQLKETCTNSKSKIVMVTHHAPSFQSCHPKFAGNGANTAFYTDVLSEFHGFDIPLWIHGHTHERCNYIENDIRVICYPFGYMNELNVMDVMYYDM